MSNLKTLLFIFLTLTLLLQAGNVLALEIQYPSLPGSQTPNQIQESIDKGLLGKDQALPLYINYFIRLFFLIAISIAVIIIIYGGILYLVSGAKPALMVAARGRISQGLLGLFILLCSYLVLAVINPQLLVFKTRLPSGLTTPSSSVSPSSEAFVYKEVPIGTLIDQNISFLDEEITLEPGSAAAEALSKIGDSRIGESIIKIHRIEKPFLEIYWDLDEAVTLVRDLKAQLAKCRCGQSNYHIERKTSDLEIKYSCAPGLKKEEYIDKCKDKGWAEESVCDTLWENVGNLTASKKQICLNQCQDCGQDKACDLREVREKKDADGNFVLDRVTKKPKIEIKTDDGWKDIATAKGMPADKKATETSIKYKKLLLTRIYSRLKMYETKLSSEQMDSIQRALLSNAAGFLAENAPQPLFQNDFSAQKRDVENMGFETKTELFTNFPEPEMVTMSPLEPDPFTLFYISQSPLLSPEIEKRSKKITEEAERMSNSFSVFTQLSIEEIEKMLQACLSAAFGEDTFSTASLMGSSDFLEMIEETTKQGLKNFLGDVFSKKEGDLANAFTNQLKSGIKERVTKEECDPGKPDEKCREKRIAQCEKDCLTNPRSGETKDSCLKKCHGKTIPEHFLSDKIAELFTKNIGDQLGPTIKEVLNKTLMDFINDTKVKHLLTDDLVTVLDGIMQGAMSKSLEKQIPGLKNLLQKKMVEVLPELISDPMEVTDKLLTKYLKKLKKMIDNQIDNASSEVASALIGAISGDFDKYKAHHPDLFRESQSPANCWQNFMDGYYFDYDDDSTCAGSGAKGICKKATPEDINNLMEKIAPNIEFAEHCVFNNREELGFDTIEGYCRSAGYCWNKLETDDQHPSGKCERCSGDYWIHLSDLKPTKENINKWAEEFFSGLVNFGEQFLAAFVQTATYTMGQYAKVWVEDAVLMHYEPYFMQMNQFQQKLHKFVQSSVKDNLPKQLQAYLSSNIDQIIADLCQKAKNHQPLKIYNVEITLSKDPKNGLTWEEAEKNICHIHDELHQSILDNLEESGDLGKKIVKALETPVYDLVRQGICKDKPEGEAKQQCLNAWGLNQSLAEILWPGLAAEIEDLIKGTPKKIICSEFAFQKWDDECNAATTTYAAGLLSVPTKDGLENMSQAQQAYCGFYWFACGNIFSQWKKSAGEIIYSALTKECQKPENKDEDWCKTLTKKSVAYTIFKYGIENSYGKGSSNNPSEEIAVYQWLTAAFPNPKIRTDINTIINERGLTAQWTQGGQSSPKAEAEKPGRTPDNFGNASMAFISWFTQNQTVYNILTEPQFGLMAYLKSNPNYTGKNFLSRTPYQLLSQDLCSKVKQDFQRQYPNWTIERIMANKEYFPGGVQYSPESYDRATIFKAIEILIQTPEVPENEKGNYLSCRFLEWNPSQITGLDQKLARYVPTGYQIMFDLMEKELTNQDRPEPLNDLLDYIYNNKPPSALKKAGEALIIKAGEETDPQKTSDIATGADLINIADFLETKIGDQINRGALRIQIIVLAFKAFCAEKYKDEVEKCENRLYQRIGWQKWRELQDILAKTPAELIGEYLDYRPFQGLPGESIMGLLAKNSFLGQPYIDTLGRALHLTEPIYKFYLSVEDAKAEANKAVGAIRKKTQNITHKAFLDYPSAGLSWIGKSLAGLLGIKIGEQAAEQAYGKCQKAKQEEIEKENCDDPEMIYKERSKECCSLGKALVCELRCREKPKEEEDPVGCKTDEGEVEETHNGVVYCCFDNCQRCRPKQEGQTCWENEKEKGNLCCRDRETSPDNKQCCVNIMRCVADKFSSFLEDALIYNLMDGPALPKLGPDKPSLPELPPPPGSSCPVNPEDIGAMNKFCMTPKKLAECNNAPYTDEPEPTKTQTLRSPSLQKLLNCIKGKTGQPLPAEGQSNSYYGSLFTWDHDHEICNYSRGIPLCGEEECSHTKHSCHYGGEINRGAMAVDFGNEYNLEPIKKAAIACMVEQNGISKEEAAKHILFEGKKGESGTHIHISTPDCGGY